MLGELSRRARAAGTWCAKIAGNGDFGRTPFWSMLLVSVSPCLLVFVYRQSVSARNWKRDGRRHFGTAGCEEAIRAIPWKQLAEPQRRKLQYRGQNASMYRRLPTRVIDCDPDLFTFLLQHPEVVVDVWQMMGVSKVTLQQVADQAYPGRRWRRHHRQRFVICYANWGPEAQNLAVIYADGAYDGKPFIKPLRAKS